MGIREVKALELRNLVVYIEQEKFTPENYECQMAYLGQIMPSFEQVLFLKHDNMASLFLMENMAESICLTYHRNWQNRCRGWVWLYWAFK